MTIIGWIKGAFNWRKLEREIVELDNKLILFEEENNLLRGMLEGEKINSAKNLGTISNYDLRQLLSQYCKSEDIKLSDMVYGLTSVEEAKKYSVATKVYINQWKQEEFDCDEFSFALAGYWNLDLYQFAFGIAWSATHAYNIMVDNNKDIYVVEPQTNKFIPIGEAIENHIYFPFRFIII